ncbi:Os01g0586200 [Oryza sativa Japonica Group]|nr:Os01g0586200 [Oryza sativa Japonica Group]
MAGRPSASSCTLSSTSLPSAFSSSRPTTSTSSFRHGGGDPSVLGAREAIVRTRDGHYHPPDDVAQEPQHARLCLAAGLVSSVALTVSLLWAGVVDKGFHVALESERVAHCPQPLLPLLRRPWFLPNRLILDEVQERFS